MPRYRITLDKPIPIRLSDELGRRVYFLSELVTDFLLVAQDERIVALEVTSGAPLDADLLEHEVNTVVAEDILPQRDVRAARIWESSLRGAPVRPVFDELVEAGFTVELGEGLIGLTGPVPQLIDYLDRRLRDVAVRRFHAQEYRYPTLLSGDVVQTAGYLASFPHLLFFVERLQGDPETYRAFADGLLAERPLSAQISTFAQPSGYMLPPTMCFHTYHQLSGATIPEGGLAITAVGKSFRHESRYHHSLERLWDFTIRETTFFGSAEAVLEQRRRFVEEAGLLAQELGLSGTIEASNDPFLVGADTAKRVWSQRLMEQKYELRVPVGADRSVAVASFNAHGEFFGRSFGINAADGAAVHSACTGFGLERFAYAYMCHHGIRPEAWPEPVRSAVLDD